MPNILNFTLIATGAFVFWALKGFKGKFNDEMVGPYDRSSKRVRNITAGSIALLMILIVIGSL